MKTKFSSLLFVAVMAAAMALTASAALLCDSGTVSNVVGTTCTEGQLTFSNFSVSASSGFTSAQIGIGGSAQGTGVFGNNVDLAFQIGGLQGSGVTSALGDVELQYEVTGGVGGVDITLQASPLIAGGSETVTEIACSAAFIAGVCSGNTLANYVVISTGAVVSNSQIPWLPPYQNYDGPVFIKKDLSYDGATTSELVNSQATVPEPMTFSLVGAGLLGLGLLGRRLRK